MAGCASSPPKGLWDKDMSRVFQTPWISCDSSIRLSGGFVKSEKGRMETCFVEALEKRARTMLPPATVMRIECMADGGNAAAAALLAEVQGKGLRGEPLCGEPCETVVFEDRVLLRCGGCLRMEALPHVAGVGFGHDAEEARKNALYALTLPLDHPSARWEGCVAAQRWGEGPVRDVQIACIINRAAYR